MGIQLLHGNVIIPFQCPCYGKEESISHVMVSCIFATYGKEESISHVMVSCIFATRVWKELGLGVLSKRFCIRWLLKCWLLFGRMFHLRSSNCVVFFCGDFSQNAISTFMVVVLGIIIAKFLLPNLFEF